MAQPSPFKSEKDKEIFHFFVLLKINHVDEIRKTLESGKISPDVVNERGNSALIVAIDNQARIEVILLLLNNGADVNKRGRFGITALMEAAKFPDSKLVKTLLERGADPDIQDIVGRTALMFAVREGMNNNVDVLLEGNANPMIRDKHGMNSLHYAAHDGNVEAIRKLIDIAHMDVNMLSSPQSHKPDEYGSITPLFIAVSAGNKDAVELLLEYNADPNIPEQEEKITPLMLVALKNDVDIGNLLLSHGANRELRHNNGKTAEDLAREKGNFEILTILKVEEINTSEPWKGLTQSDISKFSIIFEDRENYSCCPVCLGFIERREACRYMKHNCNETPGVIAHKDLYDLYKNDEGKISWCTICGRVCKGHRHYQLAPYQSTELPELTSVPNAEGTAGLFGGEKECIADGGGGLVEKVKRFERMIAYAKELQGEVGKISEKEARKELVEESWNAPMARRRNIPKILEQKKWTTNISTFPKSSENNIKNNTNNVVYPDIPKLPGEEKPIFNPSGYNNVYGGDDVPTLQFIHDNKGVINRHEDSKISIEALIDFIRIQAREFGDPKFGYCFDYPRCEGRIYPQDIAPYWEAGNASNEDKAAFEKYHREFNKKFSAEVQRGGYEGFMVNIEDSVQCVTKRKGGARKTRKNRKVKRQTRRRK